MSNDAPMRRLLPVVVAVHETWEDLAAKLHPAEEEAIQGVSVHRRQEFITGRACARTALALLGASPSPILPGVSREPLWPRVVTGSITHCKGYCCAAVARRANVAAMGIDAEPHLPLPDGVLARVANHFERTLVSNRSNAVGGVHWDRVLWCAKEALFKAWYPRVRIWLDYKEVEVDFDVPEQGALILRIKTPRRPTGFPHEIVAKWAVSAGIIVSALVIPSGRDEYDEGIGVNQSTS